MRRALEGLISSLISSPDSQSARVRSPARLEQLWNRLQDCTLRYSQRQEGQHRRICEVLQEITELVVWGDQNSSRANSEVSSCANAVVDMFLETSVHMGRIPFKGEHRGKRILDDLHILLDLTDRKHSMLEGSREIKRQLLQTFNMLVQNINNDQVINLIIVHYMRDIIKYEFDWDDEDQVNLYISLLRSLSLRLNDKTVELFFQPPTAELEKVPGGAAAEAFPLFTRAIKFLHPKFDIQQRISIRIITLKVFAVNHPPVRQFLGEPKYNILFNFFKNCSFFARDPVTGMNSVICNDGLKPNQDAARQSLLRSMDDLLDFLEYFRDVLKCDCTDIHKLLLNRFHNNFLRPQALFSLGLPHDSSYSSDPGESREGGGCELIEEGLALLVLALSLQTLNFRGLSDAVIELVFLEEVANGDGVTVFPCRNCLLEKVASSIDAQKLYAILFLSVAALHCSASPQTLEAAGICPRFLRAYSTRNGTADAWGSPARGLGGGVDASPGRGRADLSIDGLTKKETEWSRGVDMSSRSDVSSGGGMRPGVARLVALTSSFASAADGAAAAVDPIDAACTALGGRNLSMITRDSSSEESEDEAEAVGATVWHDAHSETSSFIDPGSFGMSVDIFRKVVVCMTEGSKIVIDACEAFLISMLLPPPTSSSASAASAAVTDRYHTPSPFGSGYQTPFDDAPPVPPKIISILQAQANEVAAVIKQFSRSSIDMLVADVLQSCIVGHKPLDLRVCVGAKATHEMLLRCMRDPKGPRSLDMNEWEKLKRACWRFAALMRVLTVVVPSMEGSVPDTPGSWRPHLVAVKEAKVNDIISVGAEEERELLSCWLVQAQRQRFRLWVRDSSVLLCAAHPSELNCVVVKACYGFNRLNEAEFAKANLPREQADRDRCLLLTVRPTVDRLEAAAVGKQVAISSLVTEEMVKSFIAFESEDKASAALEHVRRSHAAFKEKQKMSLEKVLLNARDLSE